MKGTIGIIGLSAVGLFLGGVSIGQASADRDDFRPVSIGARYFPEDYSIEIELEDMPPDALISSICFNHGDLTGQRCAAPPPTLQAPID